MRNRSKRQRKAAWADKHGERLEKKLYEMHRQLSDDLDEKASQVAGAAESDEAEDHLETAREAMVEAKEALWKAAGYARSAHMEIHDCEAHAETFEDGTTECTRCGEAL